MSKPVPRSTGRYTALTIGLTIAAVVTTSPVAAQILVTDGASISANNAGFGAQLAKTIQQYAQQVQSYATQVQQYEQMLTKVMNLGTDFSIMPNTMTEMDAGPLIQANCSSNNGSIIGNFVSQITTSLMSQSVVKSQQQICAAIITTQVDKYNTTVRMMKQIQSNLPAVQKFTDLASSFSNLGRSGLASTANNSGSVMFASRLFATPGFGSVMSSIIDSSISRKIDSPRSSCIRANVSASRSAWTKFFSW